MRTDKENDLILMDDIEDARRQIEECIPAHEYIPETTIDRIRKDDAIKYMFNENHRSIFTVETLKHNMRYTYRVKPGKEPRWYTVAVLYGPDNGKDYRNIGYFDQDKKLFYTNTTWQIEHTQPVKVFSAFLNVIFGKEKWPEKCKFYYSQRCLRCGKMLTTPESIKRGYGDTCWDAVNSIK